MLTVLALIQNPAIQPKHLQTVRTVISGAAPLGAADVERFHKKTGNKIDLIQLYGLTETSPVVTLQSGKVPGGVKIGGSGLLVPNAECKVVPVNDITHPGLAANESGELLFKGPQVCSKIRKGKELFPKNPWFAEYERLPQQRTSDPRNACR